MAVGTVRVRGLADDLRITSSSNGGSRRFTAVQRVWAYLLELVWTVLNCNWNCNSVTSCRSWRTVLAQHLFGDIVEDNRDDHAVTSWLQTRPTSVDRGRCGLSVGEGGLFGVLPGIDVAAPVAAHDLSLLRRALILREPPATGLHRSRSPPRGSAVNLLGSAEESVGSAD